MSEGDRFVGKTLEEVYAMLRAEGWEHGGSVSFRPDPGLAPDGLPVAVDATPYAIGSERWPGLSKLTEEAGEVLQVVGKIIATGGRLEHWDGTDLRTRLVEELGDLAAAIVFVAEANDLLDEIEVRKVSKLATFRRWHREGR